MDHPNDQKKKKSNSKGFKGDRLGDPPGDPQGDRSIITITRLFVLKKTPLQERGCEVAGSNLRGAFGLKLCTDKAFEVVSVGKPRFRTGEPFRVRHTF